MLSYTIGDDFAGRPAVPKIAASLEEASAPTKPSTSGHSKTAQKILAAQKQPAAQTLFMGNLPFETKEEEIRQMIEGHGLPSDLEEQAKNDGIAKTPGGKPLRWLKKIRMGTFEDTGLCKGCVFCLFKVNLLFDGLAQLGFPRFPQYHVCDGGPR